MGQKTMQQTKQFKKMRRWLGGLFVFLLMLSGMAADWLPCMNGAVTALAAEDDEERVALSKKKITINTGEKFALSVSGNYKEVVWKVKNEYVATVSNKGVVKGEKVGTTTVYAIVDGRRYSCKVVVENPRLTIREMTGLLGATAELTVSGTSREITFSSDDPSIASISEDGIITFRKVGTTTVYAEIANKKLSCKIVVVKSLLADLFDTIGELAVTQEKLYRQVTKIYNKIITEDMTDVEKLCAFHNYIIVNTSYDYENYFNDSLPDTVYTAEGVFFEGKAVCQGYAEALKLFLDMAGIESKLVYGYGWNAIEGDWEGHAWNLVKLGNNWYHVDTTWDDPDTENDIYYDYFCIPDSVMDDDHNWKKRDYPKAAGGEYSNYYK